MSFDVILAHPAAGSGRIVLSLTLALLDLAGAVALLLWGVHMAHSGMQRAFGPHLRRFLGATLRNRLVAFLAGLGVTALLQSSTATGLMAAGFAAQGLVALAPALAVMLGANVGTTLIVQVLSFDVAAGAPVLILVGVILFRRTRTELRDFGRVLIGLGLVLMALHAFLTLLGPLAAAPLAREMLGQLSTHIVFLVLVGGVLAWGAHSSVATVLLAMSLAASQVLPLPAAIAVVLGANLGAAVNPVLEGAKAGDPAGRRLALGNLLSRATGVAVALAAFPYVAKVAPRLDAAPARALADIHTLFDLVLAAVLLPWLDAYARMPAH